MNRLTAVLAAVVVSALTGIAQAQTSELVGKVLDAEGKPVAGAEVAAANTAFPERVYKGTSDKKGTYFVTGLLYAAQAQSWSISIKAEGWVPLSVKIVARDAQKTLYFSDDVKLGATRMSTELKIRAFSEVRLDYTMRPGDAAAESAPVPLLPGAGSEGAPGASSATDAYAQAVEKVRSGDVENSVDLFKTAIEEKPDDWERRDLFAKVLLKLDRQGEATIQANKAAQLAPDKAGPLITLTDIYLARGLADKAAEAIAKAQVIEPDSTKVLERAAAVAAGAGKLDDAIALSEKVLAVKPDNTEVLVSLAALYNRNKQPKKAEEVLDKVVALDPANAHRTFYNLGVVIENRDDATESDHRKAIEAFRKAINLKPDYAIAHRDLGFALLRTGDLMAARKELQKYVDLDPRGKDTADIKATIKSLDSAK
jgi:Flp pilus assembly protein TadD